MSDTEKKQKIEKLPTEKDSTDAVWNFAFAVEQELTRVGAKIEEKYTEGECNAAGECVAPAKREYYLVQTHGPFPTRGEALMHALRLGLVRVEKA